MTPGVRIVYVHMTGETAEAFRLVEDAERAAAADRGDAQPSPAEVVKRLVRRRAREIKEGAKQ